MNVNQPSRKMLRTIKLVMGIKIPDPENVMIFNDNFKLYFFKFFFNAIMGSKRTTVQNISLALLIQVQNMHFTDASKGLRRK